MNATPRSEGYAQPAEWSLHRACWTAWPSHEDLWQENLEPAREAVAALIRAIADVDPDTGAARGETPCVLVHDHVAEASARAHLAGVPARFVRIPFGDIWLRDTAPIFVRRRERRRRRGALRLQRLGREVRARPRRHRERARRRGLARRAVRRVPWVLEGGSVEVDGEGTVLTTAQCLLNPNRNPGCRATRRIERA
jgi:agmatine deiminase